jgi:Flp pilus assembly protein CpaB
MATAVLSPSKVLRRPRHLDRRAVLGVFLLLVAVGGSLAFWTASSSTTAVLVATHNLPAGATLSAGDVAIARVRVDDATYQAAVPASELGSVVDLRLDSPVFAHQLLVRAQLSSSLPLRRDQMEFTIPVTPDTAVGGSIRPGDVVEVMVTTGKDTTTSQSTVVVWRAPVYDVGYGGNSTTISTAGSTTTSDLPTQGTISWLTLIVNQTQALKLARAKWSGQLDVALRPSR